VSSQGEKDIIERWSTNNDIEHVDASIIERTNDPRHDSITGSNWCFEGLVVTHFNATCA
jgi:hypothetical protein